MVVAVVGRYDGIQYKGVTKKAQPGEKTEKSVLCLERKSRDLCGANVQIETMLQKIPNIPKS
jgi:hypothetical protein